VEHLGEVNVTPSVRPPSKSRGKSGWKAKSRICAKQWLISNAEDATKVRCGDTTASPGSVARHFAAVAAST
jgi:hypothetical protein